jgi:putative membrane-bound dehydrogenase-like protein
MPSESQCLVRNASVGTSHGNPKCLVTLSTGRKAGHSMPEAPNSLTSYTHVWNAKERTILIASERYGVNRPASNKLAVWLAALFAAAVLAPRAAAIAKQERVASKNAGDRVQTDEELKEFLKPIPAKTPQEALKTFETSHGFRMELVASEPLVVDPIAAEFDENGQLYVCEMVDYPYKPKPGQKPLGTVRLLRDTDGDGVFDESHVFADGMLWAGGVVPWKGGVFVAAPPDIWYLKDTDGDFKADVKIKIFTGFGLRNQQSIMNNLRFGLDHKIYGSTSYNGGAIRKGDDDKSPGVTVTGHDFRFDPEKREFETITGTIQFGNTFDDWGNRFLCSQAQPLLHVVLPQEYLARNPYLAVPTAINDIAHASVPVYRISPIEHWRQIRSDRLATYTLRNPAKFGVSQNVIDAAAGVTIYRGSAYPKEFYGNVFVGEAQHNLVHRRTLVPDGVTFKSERADQNTEFVRSSDNWFRPVNFINAPDGTLYVLDMSREIIESNNIPLDVAKYLDLKNGRTQGRIFRLAPPGFRSPKPPRLGQASAEQLVTTLENPNGWWRDTAQRLIYERQDKACVPNLRALLANSKLPQARLLALWSLQGLGELSDHDIEIALSDRAPEIREHAIRRAETHLDASPKMLDRVLSLANDPNARVCLQLAFTLGETKDSRAISVLAGIAKRYATDQWIRTAVLSSVAQTSDRLFVELLSDDAFARTPAGTAFLVELAHIVGARGQMPEISRVIAAVAEHRDGNRGSNLGTAVVLGLGSGMKQSGSALPDSNRLPPQAGKFIQSLIARAESLALDEHARMSERLQSIKLVGCRELAKAQLMLRQLLRPDQPKEVQLAVLDVLAEYKDPSVASWIIAGWNTYLPAVRTRAIRVLLSRDEWAETYLAAVENKQASVAEIDPPARVQLLQHRNGSIREIAKKLFANSPRDSVIAEYRPVLQHLGDPSRGELIYKRECSACHHIRDMGYEVGPDLASSPSRNPDALLTNILDPNRMVDPAFLQYVVVDKSGRTFTGKIVAETATSVTLTSGKGVQETVLRANVDEMASTGKSLMPEGFEKTIPKAEMADLIAFLNGLESAPGTKRPLPVAGTHPGTEEP